MFKIFPSLHDLRLFSPSAIVSTFQDGIETNTQTYCILPIDDTRVMAGAARHSLIKMFDLRYSTNSYTTTAIPNKHTATPRPAHANQSLPPPSTWLQSPGSANADGVAGAIHGGSTSTGNYNLYLRRRHLGQQRHIPADADSPVYCLSQPSSTAPIIYAGLENRVVQIDVFSLLDRHPDPYQARNGLPSTTVTDSDHAYTLPILPPSPYLGKGEDKASLPAGSSPYPHHHSQSSPNGTSLSPNRNVAHRRGAATTLLARQGLQTCRFWDGRVSAPARALQLSMCDHLDVGSRSGSVSLTQQRSLESTWTSSVPGAPGRDARWDRR